MLTIFLKGMTLGFSAGVTPGPFQAYLISKSLKNGWRRTFPAAFAPLLSDGPIIFLVLVVLTQTPDWFIQALQLVGGLFILYLAWGAYKSYKAPPATMIPQDTSQLTLLEATVMNALNPNPYIFWSTLAGPILVAGWREAPALGVVFILGFYLFFISFLIGFIYVFAKARAVGSKITKNLSGVAALALFIFGITQIIDGINSLR